MCNICKKPVPPWEVKTHSVEDLAAGSTEDSGIKDYMLNDDDEEIYSS